MTEREDCPARRFLKFDTDTDTDSDLDDKEREKYPGYVTHFQSQ